MSITSISLGVLAVAAAMAVLQWAREAFIPIVLSVFISYALEPVVRGLCRLRISRVLASALVMVTLTGSIALAAYTLSDDAAAVVAELPEAATKLRASLRRGQPDAIQQVQEAAKELQRTAEEATGRNPAPQGVQRVQIEDPTIDVRRYLFWGSASVVTFAGQATLVVFFVFFLLASGDLFKRKLVTLAGPSMPRRRITVQVLEDIDRQIERFLIVRVVASVIVGMATWIAFEIVGLSQAGLWGLAAGIFNSVPYFGPVIVAAGTFVVAFMQFDSVSMAVYVAGISLVITSLEGWLLTPWLTSRAVRTNEVAVFVGLIIWTFLWGIWGTLLAVPMLAAFKACCDRIEGLKPIGELLGE